MELTLERPDYDYFLRGANARVALVNDRRLQSSFAVSPRHLIEDWPVTDPAALDAAALEPLLALDPEVIILGTGGRQVFPPAALLADCLRRGVGLEAMDNAAAARTFTVLAAEQRRVVAAFVLPG